MAKRYARLNWNSTSTYVSASNLNVMDKGIDDCDNAIEVLNDGLKAVNNNLGGSIKKFTFTFSTNNNDEMFSFPNALSNTPMIIGCSCNGTSLLTSNHITNMYCDSTMFAIVRDSAGSYGGGKFDVLLFVPN